MGVGRELAAEYKSKSVTRQKSACPPEEGWNLGLPALRRRVLGALIIWSVCCIF